MAGTTEELRSTLAATQFLRELTPDDLDKVVAIASITAVPAGAVLFKQGETSENLHIVSKGLVALDMCMPRQGCTRLQTVGPGELLGWSALLGDGVMTAQATAVEESTLIALPGQDLRQLCDADHDIGYAIMQRVAKSLSRRLLATRLQMLDVFGETQPVQAPLKIQTAIS